jgi:ketosteroid isomerase-like protein
MRIWGLARAGCLLLGAVGAAGALGDGRERQQTDREAIQGVIDAQQRAWNQGEIEAFLRGYWRSPELTFAGSNGVTRGWDAVLVRYKEAYPDRAAMGQLSFSELEFRFLGADGALVLGRWHLERANRSIGGVFSLVWQRVPEGWRIVHDHTSVVAEARPNEPALGSKTSPGGIKKKQVRRVSVRKGFAFRFGQFQEMKAVDGVCEAAAQPQ